MKPELRFEEKIMRAAELGEECSLPDLLGEAVLQNELIFQLGEEDEIYEGYGRRTTAYPYRQRNGYTRKLKERTVQRAVLENEFLKAVFLPEYGGRLWELWDKEKGRNLLYTNDVLRFGNLAVRNAWFSGGVEWNLGVIGHTPFTTEPLYTAELESDTGAPVLRMYEYERIRGLTYQMDFWLEDGERMLNCRMRVTNEGAKVAPMYWWSNMAVEEYPEGRVIVPAKEAFTNREGVVYKVELPLVDGVDVTDYQNIPKSVDYFFHLPKEQPKFIANVDKSGCGLLQISTSRQQGRKLFSWGNGDASDRWQEFLTEKAGRYVEIQAGLAKTQYGCIPMAPHTAWEWMEQYGAIQADTEILEKGHLQRGQSLTEKLSRQGRWEKLEERLEGTKMLAKKPGRLRLKGSGYGALAAHGRMTEHLEFSLEEEGLKKWKRFFETGILHCPKPEERPDAFLIDERNVSFLEEHMKGKNKENWYAWYQLGLGRYQKGEYERAGDAFEKSLELAENPWALHGLSCVFLLENEREKAARRIIKGIKMRSRDVGYLKEGFRLLDLCGADQELCKVFDSLGKQEQEISRLRFYLSRALHRLGEDEKAWQVLEGDGGLEMEDIREGEDSIAQLWGDLHVSLFKEEKETPHRYNFKAY